MRLQVLLDEVEHVDIGLLEVSGDREVDVASVTHDSRRVVPGGLFACVPGLQFDGHEHAVEAVENGAVALLVERALPISVSQIQVRDVRIALGPVASAAMGRPSHDMACLGVTGTNGKTSTTYLLEAIGQADGRPVGVIGTTGARVGGVPVPLEHTTPEAPELQQLLRQIRDSQMRDGRLRDGRLRDGQRGIVAMEVSSHALAQHRVDGTRFAAVAFTNLSHDHLDYHGSFDEYFEAKARLFTPEFTGAAAIGIDDERGPDLVSRARTLGLTVLTYAIGQDADVVATELRSNDRGMEFVLTDRRTDESVAVSTSLIGELNVLNALAAASLALLIEIDLEAIARGLAAAAIVPGRMERVDVGQEFTVLVDYAHTPAALAHALDAARAHAHGHRLIAVVGCGGDRDREKRPAMGALVGVRADAAFLTSDNPRSESAQAIVDEMLAGVPSGLDRVQVEIDRRLAIRRAIGEADRGDVVLIAGKGHESGQTTGTTTVPFDDRVVVREELEALS